MGWAYGSQGALASAANTNTVPVSVAYPSGISAGDILFYIAHAVNNGDTFTWSNSPTSIASSSTSSPISISATIATGSESGSVTLSGSSTGRVQGVILRYTGGPATLTGIVHDSQNTGSSATTGLAWPGLTITQPNTLILLAGGKSNIAWTSVLPDPPGSNERVDVASGGVISLVVDDIIQTSAANLSGGTWTITGDGSGARRTLGVSLLSGARAGALVNGPLIKSLVGGALVP